MQRTEAGLANPLERAIKSSRLSSYNPTRLTRNVEGTAEAAEATMSKLYGVDKFYIDNPFVATAIRWAQSEKMIADKKFLEKLYHYGITPVGNMQRSKLEAAGWGPLNTPDFRGKTLKIEGFPIPLRMEDRLFPPNIVNKVGYWMKPNEITNFGQFVRSYNRVMKVFVLSNPGFHLRNTVEGLFKYHTDGGTIKGLVNGAMATLAPVLACRCWRQEVYH
jgi:hypothetical protein